MMNHIVPVPRISGNSPRNGPWPECLDLSGEECAHYIQTYSPNVRGNVIIINPSEDDDPKGFDPQRVIVHVNSYDVVTEIPHRG